MNNNKGNHDTVPSVFTHSVFDGHNDVLLRLWETRQAGGDAVREFMEGTTNGHIDRLRAKAGGLSGGLCAIYIPSPHGLILADGNPDGHYETPLAAPLDRQNSLNIALQFSDLALEIERAGGWKICRSVGDIRAAQAADIFAAVIHMEGCEALDENLEGLETFYAAGLRSLGPVWSRNNIFGHGVPFAYPKSPDTGPGLTDVGKHLIRACDRMGIVVDVSHITEQGFWDIANISTKPFMASHSNAHALSPVARNLTDKQMDAIAERKGVAGLNFAATMLRPDGKETPDTQIDYMVQHINYMVARMGIDCVALGSDFDGATIPAEIGDATGLPKLITALSQAGYDETMLNKLCRENWLRLFSNVWGF